MDKYLPILIVAGIISVFTLAFLMVYIKVKRDKTMQEYARNMPDRVIIKRLLNYARPYIKTFVLVFVIILNLWDMAEMSLARFNPGAYFVIVLMCTATLLVYSMYFTERKAA